MRLSLNFSGLASKNPAYLANVLLIVKKTISLANQPPLAPADLGDRTADWMEELEPEIPLDLLPQTFTLARRNHSGSYPINCLEILDAWKANKADLRQKEEKRKAEAAQTDPVLNCANKDRHLNAEGTVKIVNLFDTSQDEIVPCQYCRFPDYEKWRKTQVALYGEHKPLVEINAEFKATESIGKLLNFKFS